MAIMWQSSLVPFIDPNGDPRSGMKAFFFASGTTTPRTVYIDSGLNEPHDHPVVADASGVFPAVFLPAGDYRQRLTTAAGVTVSDVDGISTPSTGESGGGGGGGDTPEELLARTGDYKFRHDTGTHSGWVRANGRTLGSATSGATERANDDCEDLFLHLWNVDTTLVVSGGRGGNAASDWASAKRIALPDIRSRGLMGLSGMGGAELTLLSADQVDGSENAATLGATGGADKVTLSIAQVPSHNHGGVTGAGSPHSHSVLGVASGQPLGAGFAPSASAVDRYTTVATTSESAHTHSVASQGGGTSHSNMPPFALATVYIKL